MFTSAVKMVISTQESVGTDLWSEWPSEELQFLSHWLHFSAWEARLDSALDCNG